MYNSEEVYTFEENRQTQSQHPSADQHKNGRLNNSRPKNGLFSGQKPNGISGTYARIVPKRPLHDMERLYAENIQLRERIRFLEEDCTKIKTRVSMAEKQKQQLITQLCNAQFGNNVLRDRRPSQKGLVKTQQKSVKSAAMDQNRKILHGYKDEISKLKLQNGRLKKTVKYTQIQELQTQNQLLHEQMARMKRYTQDVIENTQYDEYQKQIEALNKQLQSEKDSKKNIQMQVKKKDEEMEDLKNKMKIIANRKSQLQKKYNRQITSVKTQLHRAKEKEKQYFITNQEKKQTSKPKIIEKIGDCKKCSTFKDNLQSQKEKNKELSSKLSAKQKQLTQLQKKIKELEIKNSKISEPSSPNKEANKSNEKIEKDEKKHDYKEQRKQTQGKEKQKTENKQPAKPEKQKLQQPKTKEQKSPVVQKQQVQKENYDSDQDDYNQDSQGMVDTKNFNVEQSEDKVDVFHVNLSNQKQDKHEAARNNKKSEQDRYEEQFDESENKKLEDDSQEQVLFQKQEKNKPKKKKGDQPAKQKRKQKEKQKQKEKEREKQKQKQKESQKQKGGSGKAQKILKQTIKYRLMAQRYSYPDFHRDIKQSGATQFTIQELIQMLTNQPFFLSQQHLKLVLYSLFQKEELDETDTTTTNSFLKKMKIFIGQFQIKDQAEEQLILKSIQSKLSKKKVLIKMKQQSINETQISKKNFVKVLKQFVGLNEAQIEQCLAEASVLSVDIAHINYPEFLQKLGYS